MADSAVETKETTPVVEKETVISSAKESPIKETNGKSVETETVKNGASKNGAPKENGSSDNGTEKEKEEDDEEDEEEEDEDEVKENGDSDACPIKRKSCSGDAEAPEVTTPEKKQKLVDGDDVEETEEGVEA